MPWTSSIDHPELIPPQQVLDPQTYADCVEDAAAAGFDLLLAIGLHRYFHVDRISSPIESRWTVRI